MIIYSCLLPDTKLKFAALGWRGDWDQHVESDGWHLLCHTLRQNSTVPGRVLWQAIQRYDATFYVFILLLLFNHQDKLQEAHFENWLQELDQDAVFTYSKGVYNSAHHFCGCYFSSLCALLRYIDSSSSLVNPCPALPNRIMTLQINYTEENASICQVFFYFTAFHPLPRVVFWNNTHSCILYVTADMASRFDLSIWWNNKKNKTPQINHETCAHCPERHVQDPLSDPK